MLHRICIAATSIVLLGGACYQDDALAPAGGRPVARVFLTDAPFPYDSVASVEVYVVSVAASTDPDTSGDAEWETIAEPKQRYDLLTLQQGDTALLGQGELRGQLYRAIRIVIDADSSSVRWNNGSTARVSWPWPGSGRIAMHALVVEPLATLADASQVEIVIDWDLGKSFLYNHYGTNEFTVMPWLRAVHAAFTGTIAGTVTSDYTGQTQPVQNANVTAYSGNPGAAEETWWAAATGRTDAQGRYKIAFVSDGTYILKFEQPQYPFLDPVVMPNVVVDIGQTTAASVSLPEAGAAGSPYVRVSGPRSVGIGGTITLFAAVGDQNGDPIPSPSVTWSSSNTAVASVSGFSDTAGVYGRQAGFATITASSGALSDSLTVEVVGEPQPVATVAVIPSSRILVVGDSTGFRAELRDAGGNVLTNRPVSWFVTDSAVVRIEAAFGPHVILRARARGNAILRATAEGKVGSGSITVN